MGLGTVKIIRPSPEWLLLRGGRREAKVGCQILRERERERCLNPLTGYWF